jgi:hypothetical protein
VSAIPVSRRRPSTVGRLARGRAGGRFNKPGQAMHPCRPQSARSSFPGQLGKSGLGIGSYRATIATFAASEGMTITAEFAEMKTGKSAET